MDVSINWDWQTGGVAEILPSLSTRLLAQGAMDEPIVWCPLDGCCHRMYIPAVHV